MKALSIKNPMATLVVQGTKTIEIRSFKTKYRGKLAICSSQNPIKDTSIYHPYFDHWSYCRDYTAALDGFILGTVDLVEVVPFESFSQEMEAMVDIETIKANMGDKKYYGWVLENSKELDLPIPIKGKLGVFELPAFERIILEQKGFAD